MEEGSVDSQNQHRISHKHSKKHVHIPEYPQDGVPESISLPFGSRTETGEQKPAPAAVRMDFSITSN
jgi:hypothetical protein